ncbi:hypothetical protein DFJ74DRAFT_693004 [Hyaloraphidium curvatum]|nr:hypothetical protein DFJ74DRAFT_693004 [Hyaloraphidium curvatum]
MHAGTPSAPGTQFRRRAIISARAVRAAGPTGRRPDPIAGVSVGRSELPPGAESGSCGAVPNDGTAHRSDVLRSGLVSNSRSLSFPAWPRAQSRPGRYPPSLAAPSVRQRIPRPLRIPRPRRRPLIVQCPRPGLPRGQRELPRPPRRGPAARAARQSARPWPVLRLLLLPVRARIVGADVRRIRRGTRRTQDAPRHAVRAPLGAAPFAVRVGEHRRELRAAHVGTVARPGRERALRELAEVCRAGAGRVRGGAGGQRWPPRLRGGGGRRGRVAGLAAGRRRGGGWLRRRHAVVWGSRSAESGPGVSGCPNAVAGDPAGA